MRHGRSDEVSSILSRIKSQESIKSIRIIDEFGKVLNSSDPGEINQEEGSRLSLLQQSRDFQILNSADAGEFVAFANIYNGPSCYGCHDSAKSVLGTLKVDLSLNYLQRYYASLRTNLAITTIIMILLVILACSIFIIVFVDRPLKQLMEAMQKLQLGDFDCKTQITSSREMSNLSEQFNQMTDKLHETLTTSISQERQLAKINEKLAHHSEIQQMNTRLAEQLQEIELLNISL
jgi:methyl-accepting chemotaxis protein